MAQSPKRSAAPSTRRLGRPPAASGEETRARLLRSARQCFADFGYAGTSNRHVAEASGLTTGAIYHYFESKQNLYIAAHEGVQEQIYERFAQAVIGLDSLFEEICAVLDEAVQLNREDPYLARFLLSRNTDVQRYPELEPVADAPLQRTVFFGAMLQRAIDRGELTEQTAPMVLDVIRVITAGLVFAFSADVEIQARSVSSIKSVLAGTLIRVKPG
jgi:AcrR family transcriptional regulator